MPGWLPTHWLLFGEAQPATTVIFVDVDGVLNVGVSIKGEAPINLTQQNVEHALELEGLNNLHANRILEAARRELGHGEGATYQKLVATSEVSEVLLHRLAEIIRAAGERCSVVLSSSWRKPQHRKRARRLEESMSAHLGEHFRFDDRTALRSENGPEERLETIGDYVEDLCRRRPYECFRLLVLEDFCINPIRMLKCCMRQQEQAMIVNSAADAERYLLSRAAACSFAVVQAKVIHTYDRWTSADGSLHEVGSGLTMEHFCSALAFLGSGCESCTKAALEAMPRCAQWGGDLLLHQACTNGW
mmetsp:Transcript_60711/g.141480  ORF Transcript_60711/g.141480 Transcript_60711/m.141480 type:complete len:303 (-) Transcript_60711:146-1054(-)